MELTEEKEKGAAKKQLEKRLRQSGKKPEMNWTDVSNKAFEEVYWKSVFDGLCYAWS